MLVIIYSLCLMLIQRFSSFTGTVRNTEPLSYEKSHNHILFIVAYDCGMKRSDKVTVTIKVNRVCHLGWKGKQGRNHPLKIQAS